MDNGPSIPRHDEIFISNPTAAYTVWWNKVTLNVESRWILRLSLLPQSTLHSLKSAPVLLDYGWLPHPHLLLEHFRSHFLTYCSPKNSSPYRLLRTLSSASPQPTLHCKLFEGEEVYSVHCSVLWPRTAPDAKYALKNCALQRMLVCCKI